LQPPPLPGQHTRELLAAHGLTPADIDALITNGVVGESS
jgi:crotonobetainyl-CoA:carnitine CoA-transferase CaiB-like acyl-CoA transferase